MTMSETIEPQEDAAPYHDDLDVAVSFAETRSTPWMSTTCSWTTLCAFLAEVDDELGPNVDKDSLPVWMPGELVEDNSTDDHGNIYTNREGKFVVQLSMRVYDLDKGQPLVDIE